MYSKKIDCSASWSELIACICKEYCIPEPVIVSTFEIKLILKNKRRWSQFKEKHPEIEPDMRIRKVFRNVIKKFEFEGLEGYTTTLSPTLNLICIEGYYKLSKNVVLHELAHHIDICKKFKFNQAEVEAEYFARHKRFKT